MTKRSFFRKCKNKLKELWFYFRWFLIGKYHCDISPSYKRFWFVVHKSLWAMIIISVALSVARVVEVIL